MGLGSWRCIPERNSEEKVQAADQRILELLQLTEDNRILRLHMCKRMLYISSLLIWQGIFYRERVSPYISNPSWSPYSSSPSLGPGIEVPSLFSFFFFRKRSLSPKSYSPSYGFKSLFSPKHFNSKNLFLNPIFQWAKGRKPSLSLPLEGIGNLLSCWTYSVLWGSFWVTFELLNSMLVLFRSRFFNFNKKLIKQFWDCKILPKLKTSLHLNLQIHDLLNSKSISCRFSLCKDR